MTHRLGSILSPAAPFVIGPTSGLAPTGPNTWQRVFTPPAAAGGTKFLILRITASNLTGADRIEVDLGYDTDVFTSASGPSFWTRPVAGNSVTIRYIESGVGPAVSSVSVVEYGRGEGLRNGGDSAIGGNTSADLFLLDPGAYPEPSFFNAAGVCPSGAQPSWENVAVLPAGLMRDTAQSVGIVVMAHAGELSSCSAALIGPDLILTAAHCISSIGEAMSASFTLDYQTSAGGTKPAGYAPRFHKVTNLVKTGFNRPPGDTRPALDYSVLQVRAASGGIGAPPLTMRPSVPAPGEELFVVHHPRGVPKKVSRKPTDPSCHVIGVNGSVVTYACDSDNGSSGSPVLDLAGRIVAVNDWAPGACGNLGQLTSAIVQDFLDPTPPAKDVDVVLVLDRSGSMSLPGQSGDTKMTEARRAAALFLDLIRTDRTHRAAVVSFSDTVTTDSGLVPISAPNLNALIGPPPARSGGVIGALAPGGWTSIGGGLLRGTQQFPAWSAAANTRTILLMTDGLQNSPPMIASVAGNLAGTQVAVIGFGGAGDLDGQLLSRLAQDHGSVYTRAGEGLSLKKFFVLAFGNIFQTGISLDPLYTMPAGADHAEPVKFGVCGEDSITVVLGWERPAARLELSLVTPGGIAIDAATPGIVVSRADTWVYFRIPLPLAGERDGTWTVNATRGREHETVSRLPAERFFLTTVVDGGPVMRPPAARHYYTGDVINPLVTLRYPDGGHVHDVTMSVEIEAPGESPGTLLARSGLGAPLTAGGEQLGAWSSTLIGLEPPGGPAVIPTHIERFELFDDTEHEPGSLEPDGVFGNPLRDLTRHEGHYTFRARAEFGHACRTAREVWWSAYVSIGIDPDRTDVKVHDVATLPDGLRHSVLTFTPMDRYGNLVGPGRRQDFTLYPVPGTQPNGPTMDAGDGSYTQDVTWDPARTPAPGIGISQPGRAPVTLAPPAAPASGAVRDGCLVRALAGLVLVLVVLLVWALMNPLSAQEPAYTVHGPSGIDLASCRLDTPTAGTASVTFWVLRAPTVSGPTGIEVTGLPAGVTAVVSPTPLTYPGWVTGQQITVAVTAGAGTPVPDAVVTLSAYDRTSRADYELLLHGTCPRQSREFTIRGAFLSNHLGTVFPVENAIVDVYRDVSWQSDPWVGSTRTGADGSFAHNVWTGIEGTYYAKLRLNDGEGVYLRDWWTDGVKGYNSANRGSNSQPLIDVGTTVITRDGGTGTPKTAIWQGGRAAFQEFIHQHGAPPPTGPYEIVIQSTAGLSAWTARSTTNWQDNFQTYKWLGAPSSASTPSFDPYFSLFEIYYTNYHEFGHALRHTVDGSQAHFLADAARWTYAREHDLCGSASGYIETEGFAFNEGWAEYWARDGRDDLQRCNIDLADLTIEGSVVNDMVNLAETLRRCLSLAGTPAQIAHAQRRAMFGVLNQGGNIIHSQGEFRGRFAAAYPQCPLPAVGAEGVGVPVPLLARWQPEARSGAAEYYARHIAFRKSEARRLIAERRVAESQLRELPDCTEPPCETFIAAVVRPHVLRGQLAYTNLVGRRFERRYAAVRRGELDDGRQQAAFAAESRKIALSALGAASKALERRAGRGGGPIAEASADLRRTMRRLELRAPVNDELAGLWELPAGPTDDAAEVAARE